MKTVNNIREFFDCAFAGESVVYSSSFVPSPAAASNDDTPEDRTYKVIITMLEGYGPTIIMNDVDGHDVDDMLADAADDVAGDFLIATDDDGVTHILPTVGIARISVA